MSPEEYALCLNEERCFVCGCATHASHQRQRQCPGCRRKWSFVRRRQEWELMDAFARGLTARGAQRKLGCAYRTVCRHFDMYTIAMHKHRMWERAGPRERWRRWPVAYRTPPERVLEILHADIVRLRLPPAPTRCGRRSLPS